MAFQKFANKGIFGPEGLIASFCSEQCDSLPSNQANSSLENEQIDVASPLATPNKLTKQQKSTSKDQNFTKKHGRSKRTSRKSKSVSTSPSSICQRSSLGSTSSSETASVTIETGKLPPEDQVFAIDLIVKKIFLHLPPRDLKTVRLVCPYWNSVASAYLEKSQTLRIFSVNKKENSKYKVRIKHANQNVTERNLDDLTSLMKNIQKYDFPHKFPCTYFRFDGGTLNNPYLQNFLSAHGRHIKKLKLNLNLKIHGLKNISYIRKLLVDQAPNIQHLKLEDYQKQYTRAPVHDDDKLQFLQENETLPNLRVLELNNNMPKIIFDEIFAAAGNLEQVLMYPTYYHANYNYFTEANKLGLLKRFIFAPSTENIGAYEEISKENNLKLKKLDLALWGVVGNWESREILPKIADILTRILHSSSDTLQRIKWQPVRFLPGLQIPGNLPQVKKLCIEDTVTLHKDVHREMGIFPLDFSLPATFPNLRIVSIELPTSDEDLTQFLYFGQFDPVPSVEEFFMKIPARNSNQYSVECVGRFSGMFPSVQTAGFGGIRNFLKVSAGIWKFGKLKKLTLSFDVFYEHDVPVMDAGFTGFNEETCVRLQAGELAGNEAVRCKPSIIDLKDLRKLNIEFYDEVDGERFDMYIPTISHLSGLYAFAMCPQLEVSISVRAAAVQNISYLKEIALPLRPHVHSGPW